MKLRKRYPVVFSIIAKFLITVLILVLIPPIILISVLLISEKNSINALPAFAEQLTGYPLPPKTVCLEELQAVGSISGMGNNRYYAVVMLVQSDLSQEQLETYYTLENLSISTETEPYDYKICITPISKWHDIWFGLDNIDEDAAFATWKAMEQEKDCYLINMEKGPVPILEVENVYYEIKRDGVTVLQKPKREQLIYNR